MQKRNIIMAALIASASVLLGSSLALAETPNGIKARGKIIIAIDVSHPPYGMLDANARETGSDVETAQLLADDLGVKLEIVPVNGTNRIPFLMTGKVDVVIASFSITEERKKVINYSKPYGVIPVVVAAPKSMAIKTIADLSGRTVSVTRGTTADIELTRIIKEGGGKANIVRYEDEATANSAVATGQQDLLAAALSTANAVAEQNPEKQLEVKIEMASYPMAMGLRKSDGDLKEWLDSWVTKNIGNGKLNTIYRKYFRQDLPKDIEG